MIREHRSRKKLKKYYEKFMEKDIIDPNVHPWVASSWQMSREWGVRADVLDLSHCLSKKELSDRQAIHGEAIACLAHLSEELQEFFQKYDISLLLVDRDAVVLKCYSSPFYQRIPGEIEGVRVGIEEIGTSSISLVMEHRAPFWIFGPEMWVEECHEGNACSAPVMVNGDMRYIVTFVFVSQVDIPQDAAIAMLLTLRNAMEEHLANIFRSRAEKAILNAAPFAVYHILADGKVAYANRLGKKRLEDIGTTAGSATNLWNVILNYPHTPLHLGFGGQPSYNEEVTWITKNKTYEDITTVVPLEENGNGEVNSIVVVSMPIEDLRTLVAHASGYMAKYSLSSMVGEAPGFRSVRDKAARVAKSENHVLIQGEPGTGKQRLAHGIHQESSRAGGPLISLRCGDATPELLAQEIFGSALRREASHPGRLELASGGSLFLDEIEKMPGNLADELAEALSTRKTHRMGEKVERDIDVRILASCDGDLKQLVERGVFSRNLYQIVSRNVLRMPTLRSRRADIPGLAKHILSELAQQHQMPAKVLQPEAVEKLMSYDWPENVKQLQGVLERAFFNTPGRVLRASDLDILGDVRQHVLWKRDRTAFMQVWKAAGGNVSRLANLLDVSRVTLYRYLKKFGIEKKS